MVKLFMRFDRCKQSRRSSSWPDRVSYRIVPHHEATWMSYKEEST